MNRWQQSESLADRKLHQWQWKNNAYPFWLWEHACSTRPAVAHRCLVTPFFQVRRGKPLRFDAGSLGGGGAKRYRGLSEEIMFDFECPPPTGISGKLSGERYMKSPGLVKERMIKAKVR